MNAALKPAEPEVANLPAKLPTMSDTLQKWLKERAMAPRGATPKPLSEAIPVDQQVDELIEEYAHLEQGDIAVKVMQGFIILQATALGDESLRKFTERCNVTRTDSQRNIDLCTLFNMLGDLKFIAKAERLGPRRILELKPYFKIDGIKQLIEGATLDGLKYSTVESLPSREIALWVRQRKIDNAKRDVEEAEANGELVPDYTPLPEEPHWLRLVREQSVMLAWRIRAELAVLTTLCDRLANAKPMAEQRGPRAETAGVVLRELESIRDHVDTIDGRIQVEFGAALETPRPESRAVLALKACRETLHSEIAKEVGKRAGECVRRTGVLGRPPTTLEAAIDSALKSDAKAE